MKKIITIVGSMAMCLMICSCCSKKTDAVKCTNEDGEFFSVNGCNYYKIKLGEHDVYQYTYSTYYGVGSDIIHFEDMCNYCKNK